MKYILVYITNPTKKEAEKIAKLLLEKRLIACANIFATRSLYHWKGKMENGREFVLLGKTENRNFNKIVKVVEKNHSYDIPCIAKLPIGFNAKYANWVKSELGSKG